MKGRIKKMLANQEKIIYNNCVYPHPYPCIYKLTFGEEFYIGQTINLDNRIKQHLANLQNGKASIKMQKAYEKNDHSFCVDVVEEIHPSKDKLYLSEREEHYIQILRPTINDIRASVGMTEKDRKRVEENKNGWGAKYLMPIRGDLIVSNAEAVKKHHAKLDEFKIRPYKEEGQRIREFAASSGRSVQDLFLESVREYMANHPEQ